MKIDLILPNQRRADVFKYSFPFMYLGLPYVAAMTPPEHEVRIIDDRHQDVDFDTDADLIGISALTPNAPRAYRLADEFRRRGKTVVMGGIHVSALPEEALQHCDAVVVGEADGTWVQLLRDFERGRLQRIYKNETWPSLAGLPIPRRDLMNPWKYLPLKTIETTRGCPHNCDFCGVSEYFGKSYRMRPIAEVEAEIKSLFVPQPQIPRWAWNAMKLLSPDFPYFATRRLLYVVDNNVGFNREYLAELTRVIREADVLWWCHATINIARDDKMLAMLRDSRCIAVNVGFESLDRAELDEMGKPFNRPEEYETLVRRFHAHNIGVMGTFMIGRDNDTPDTYRQIVDFVNRAQLDWAIALILGPLPDTRSYYRLRDEKRILTDDWEKYDNVHCVVQPRNGMTPQDIERGFIYIWKNIFSLRSVHHRIWRKKPGVHRFFYTLLNLGFARKVRRWPDEGITWFEARKTARSR
ncbi:MAG: B12-binding domain-containing radical SAM protein [Candidatus Sumerlaeia bacterium]|nr:B12-binding domain-containing radical SAM protein [Candidatus Sumerlaeia bacterium]